MLTITLPAVEPGEMWDEEKQEFVYTKTFKEQTLQLEHSLVSLQKWESKWCKPFYSREPKTDEQTIDYVRCMTLTKNVDPEIYYHIDSDTMNQIIDYIDAPMTATVIKNDKKGKHDGTFVTAENIYYWMFSLGIPIECQKWHLNTLITLIRVFGEKNVPPKKENARETMNHYATLNALRKKRYHTKG